MIPYAILQGELVLSENDKVSIRILDLSVEGFTFRLAKKRSLSIVNRGSLYFWSNREACYNSLEFGEKKPEQIAECDFYRTYRMEMEEPEFAERSLELMREYLQYIDLKQQGDDSLLSEKLTGYPADREQVFPVSLQEWSDEKQHELKRKLDESKKLQVEWKLLQAEQRKIGIELESDRLVQAFLEKDKNEFQEYYWQRQGLCYHPISKSEIKYIYFGNGFCFYRLPSSEMTRKIIKKAEMSGMKPVWILPPMKERYRELFLSIFEKTAIFLKEEKEQLEVVVNDWGTLDRIQTDYKGVFRPFLGILLNKRRKDSRLRYRIGMERQLEYLKENGNDAEFYQRYLADHYGVEAYVYESCGYEYEIPEGEHTVYFPYYQMNTAGHCVLYAACLKKNRGRQTAEEHCPGFCDTKCFLYPSILSMFGWQNSIWGYDERILSDPTYFQAISGNGKNRMILKEIH